MFASGLFPVVAPSVSVPVPPLISRVVVVPSWMTPLKVLPAVPSTISVPFVITPPLPVGLPTFSVPPLRLRIAASLSARLIDAGCAAAPLN